ncbi:arrestin domain-containing protein 3-like [Watersipora subatra]|uniref:arrestin domain-containing protein 3-like n=1 Tax=Watersipora subatra TaxID=2589382 RepID=UPI00355B521A
MGKLKALRICLSNDEPAYYPGDTVAGSCEVEISEGEFSFRSLTVVLRGLSRVHWTESKNVGARLGPYTQHFMSDSEYLRERKILTQARMGADRVTLREGTYQFPFSFILPAGTMPSSFEGKYGTTRYWLRAELKRVRARHDTRTKKTIIFLNPINVTLAEYQEPIESVADKTLCCGFCTGGHISISAHTDKSGYTPGDTIALSAQFENFTSRRLQPTAALYQRQYYYANDRQKMRTIQLVKFQGQRLSSKCNSSWSNEHLTIPNVTPSILTCGILRVVYFVKISLKIPGAMKLSTIMPVTIGSTRLLTGCTAGGMPHILTPPPYQDDRDVPAYDYSTSDEDEDYRQPPSSRSHTPPPCYSDIFDSDDDSDEVDGSMGGSPVSEENIITML